MAKVIVFIVKVICLRWYCLQIWVKYTAPGLQPQPLQPPSHPPPRASALSILSFSSLLCCPSSVLLFVVWFTLF